MRKHFWWFRSQGKPAESRKGESVIRIPETVWMADVKKAGRYGDCLFRRKANKGGPLPKTNTFRFGSPKLPRFWS